MQTEREDSRFERSLAVVASSNPRHVVRDDLGRPWDHMRRLKCMAAAVRDLREGFREQVSLLVSPQLRVDWERQCSELL